jgi:hypothetical protein
MTTMAGGRVVWAVVLAALAVLTPAGAAAASCPASLSEAIPARPGSAPGGGAFVRQAAELGEGEREAVVAAELLRGNLPGFLRRLRPVTLSASLPRGGEVAITLCVTPDYLALGSDDDFLRIPMGLPTALVVAERFGFVLPTAAMVDAIYAQAAVRLRPEPLPPGEAMRSIAYAWHHEGRIRAQGLARGARAGSLLAGHKKDLVLSNRLRAKRDRVAIYGWHRGEGQPIQPLSTVHGARYADYSHGVRLVSATAFIDGQPRSLIDILEDAHLAPLVSDEGPIVRVAALIGELAGRRLLAGGAGCTAVC